MKIGVIKYQNTGLAISAKSHAVQPYNVSMSSDSVSFSSKVNPLEHPILRTSGKHLQLITFKGLKNPLEQMIPSIRFGLEDSEEYQNNAKEVAKKRQEKEVNIKFECISDYDPITLERTDKRSVRISTDDGMVLGHLPKSIVAVLYDSMCSEPDKFKVILAESYNTSGSSKNKLLVDLEYDGGKTEDVQNQIAKVLYKNQITPEEILHKILDYKKVLYGEEKGSIEIEKAQKAIATISNVLADKKNQKILILGHNTPDGDTVGSCIGLKAALDMLDKKQVDVAIDDVLTGFLSRIQGANEIKKPADFVDDIKKSIDKKLNDIKRRNSTPKNKKEAKVLQNIKKYFAKNTKLLDKNEKYDVVVLLDIPGPSKLSNKFAHYMRQADKVVYIDHHPPNTKAWSDAVLEKGFNVKKTKEQNLYWVENKVPANAILTSIIIDNLHPNFRKIAHGFSFKKFYSEEKKEKLNKMVSGLVTGITTDTCGLRIKANISQEDLAIPESQRPKFAPSGVASWLMSLTKGDITRFKIKKQMRFSLPKKEEFYFPQSEEEFFDVDNVEEISEDMLPSEEAIMQKITSPYQRVIDKSKENLHVFKDIGLGIAQMNYDSLYNIMIDACKTDPSLNFRDIVSGFKMNPVTLSLRFNNPIRYYDDSRYKKSRIAVLIRQEEKKGKLNPLMKIADTNVIAFSFRASGGDSAQLLAGLFGGGGHPAAAGGKIVHPNASLDSRYIVKIDGKIEDDTAAILSALRNNHKINNQNKEGILKEIEVLPSKDNQGKKLNALLYDVVKELRIGKQEERLIEEVA